DVEAFYLHGSANAIANFAYQTPDHPLFLDVEIVESGYMASRGDHHMAICDRIEVRYGDRVVGQDPRLLHRGGAEETRSQAPTIPRRRGSWRVFNVVLFPRRR